MSLLLMVGIAWMVLAGPVALLIGRAIHVADERDGAGTNDPLPVFAFEANAPVRVSH